MLALVVGLGFHVRDLYGASGAGTGLFTMVAVLWLTAREASAFAHAAPTIA